MPRDVDPDQRATSRLSVRSPVRSRSRRTTASHPLCLAFLALSLILAASRSTVVAQIRATAGADSTHTPTVQEYRYRLSGAVRPLLFWLGDSDVGSARLVRSADESGCVWEFLVGTDPARAPRKLNRWGWVHEELRSGRGVQMGLMRKVDEKTLEEAEANLETESEYVFKAIRTDIVNGRARAVNTVWLLPDNYTYYDLTAVQRLVQDTWQPPSTINEGSIPAETHPGLLFAISHLVDIAVDAATREPRELVRGATTTFNFNSVVCNLKLKKTTWEESKNYGDRRYNDLVRMEFEAYNPSLRQTDRFIMVCGTRVPYRGVPIYVRYQPRWWFKSECVLDESQVFERADERTFSTQGRSGGSP